MYESERHRIILSAIQEKPVVTVQDIAELTDASEATIRRDIASLHVQGNCAVCAAEPRRCIRHSRQPGRTSLSRLGIGQYR